MAGERKKKHKKKADKAESFFKTAEWLITAFAVTLVFIVFEMQAYTIPTGSMADTLRGAHFRLRCPECGYRYEYGFSPQAYGIRSNSTPGYNVPLKWAQGEGSHARVSSSRPRCPSCGYYLQTGQKFPVVKGDRIFVGKCIYQFTEPERWDVIVFKNPTEPRINYIKRLVGKPGETVEIIDGDIYIDGEIARKPAKVQEELWMCVYDNDYQPANPDVPQFNGHAWRQPFRNINESQWDVGATDPTLFKLDSRADETHTIHYDTRVGNDFKATYAYDVSASYAAMPLCSDLMVRFFAERKDRGVIGAGLSKYRTRYRGRVGFGGQMVIESIDEEGAVTELIGEDAALPEIGQVARFRFINVDHKLTLEYGDAKIEYDLGKLAGDAGERLSQTMPQVTIFGAGELELSHVGLFRDIHYISDRILRAAEGDPFTLEEDEFFVCGDNSPYSADCRLWSEPGVGNGKEYRTGTVPRDYLIGKAFFVYWPGPAKAWDDSKLRIVPYVGGMKRISGGDGSKYDRQ